MEYISYMLLKLQNGIDGDINRVDTDALTIKFLSNFWAFSAFKTFEWESHLRSMLQLHAVGEHVIIIWIFLVAKKFK